ncbi:hypothetical protein [Dickeya solani]|uniref:Uncharacterized protein n=1 Tax=Dickeya solani TaxID=1089444 RepID=A0ABU4EKP3_9GAMM|nr:hypothetical protein [Dickeya solani]MCA6998190.1 hypothetical protein [Dickeya solani]MCA6999515.1 hypothetical protein [Dickeya solani]MCZ0823871.1 hypothetical protein [Dickeya solani]MDV6997227.1 hypothetical protein [Dickeya solani]MDV7006503.1 hypothetical protein [Dickeya solani]
MTDLLSKETLEAIIRVSNNDDVKNMAYELLQRREAAENPVFFIEIEGDDWIQSGRVPGSTFDFNNLPDGINNLYAAPPLPVVPDERIWAQAGGRDDFKFTEGWNACRAAMLKQSANSCQLFGNSEQVGPLDTSTEISCDESPDAELCDFYDANSWTELVRALVNHMEQLQEAAKRNVKPWQDTFPPTLLPAYIERIKQADAAIAGNHTEQQLRLVNSPAIPEGLRSVITADDVAALRRFEACCDDPESGGHDLDKKQVKRLEEVGALRRAGRIHFITGFGSAVLAAHQSEGGE